MLKSWKSWNYQRGDPLILRHFFIEIIEIHQENEANLHFLENRNSGAWLISVGAFKNQKNQKYHLNMCIIELSNQKNQKYHLNMCVLVRTLDFQLKNEWFCAAGWLLTFSNCNFQKMQVCLIFSMNCNDFNEKWMQNERVPPLTVARFPWFQGSKFEFPGKFKFSTFSLWISMIERTTWPSIKGSRLSLFSKILCLARIRLLNDISKAQNAVLP